MPIIVPTRMKIALARAAGAVVFAARHLVGKGDRAQCTRGGVHWDLDLREGIDFAIYLTGAFEPTTISAYARLLGPGAVACDIGANMGAHTLHLARLVGPTGRVLAFEPTLPAFTRLSRNIAANPDLAPRIVAQQMFLTPQDDAAVVPSIFASWPLNAPEDAHEAHLGVAVTTEGARASTFDTAVLASGVERVDLIKMDVDGFEEDVLRGAMKTLERFRPAIVMEVAPYAIEERGLDPDVPARLLASLGYRFYDLGGKLLSRPDKLLPDLPRGSSLNVIGRVD